MSDPAPSPCPTPRIAAAPDQTPYLLLRLQAEIVTDLERTRIANENRLRQLTRSAEDSDGEVRGFGLPLEHPDVSRLADLVDGLATLEHSAILNLQRAMRAHPLGPWMKEQPGIGLKQGARLLAAIGEPTWNTLHDRPRTVSELRSYCGLRGHTPTVRQRGVKANWNAEAKMRLFLVAEKAMQQKTSGSIYRKVYDEGRIRYDNAVHAGECRRCGPAGKPALAGSPLSKGHQHARALRLVMEEVLLQIWLAAHETAG